MGSILSIISCFTNDSITALAPLFVYGLDTHFGVKVVVTVLITFSQLRSIRMMTASSGKKNGRSS